MPPPLSVTVSELSGTSGRFANVTWLSTMSTEPVSVSGTGGGNVIINAGDWTVPVSVTGPESGWLRIGVTACAEPTTVPKSWSAASRFGASVAAGTESVIEPWAAWPGGCEIVLTKLTPRSEASRVALASSVGVNASAPHSVGVKLSAPAPAPCVRRCRR